MAIKSFNPYSPSRRFITVSAFEEITTDKPYRPLVEKLGKHAGRNNTGIITACMFTKFFIKAAVIKNNIVSLISSVPKTAFRLRLLPLNTILTVTLVSL